MITEDQKKSLKSAFNSICNPTNNRNLQLGCEIEINNVLNSINNYMVKYGYTKSQEYDNKIAAYVLEKFPNYKWFAKYVNLINKLNN